MRIRPFVLIAVMVSSSQLCAQGSPPSDRHEAALADACIHKATRTRDQCLCSAKELRSMMTDDEMDMVILVAKEDRTAFEARAAAMGATAFGEFARKIQAADEALQARCGIKPRS